jgi:2-C-methyl-D-erythritol 2,4-cyclodiphosphate synthase
MTTLDMRVGQGFDVHPFSDDPQRKLLLAGVEFVGERGVVGHSDGDVVAHAVVDALLGAAGRGDIGQRFPDTDPAWFGASGEMLLDATMQTLAEDGWRVVNADCTVICERPKIGPRREQMVEWLSAMIDAPVSVKGKRAEGLGALGRAEGIACLVNVLISRG